MKKVLTACGCCGCGCNLCLTVEGGRIPGPSRQQRHALAPRAGRATVSHGIPTVLAQPSVRAIENKQDRIAIMASATAYDGLLLKDDLRVWAEVPGVEVHPLPADGGRGRTYRIHQ